MDVAAALDHLAGGAPGGAGRLRAMIGAEIYTVGDAVRISFRRLPRLELPGHRSFQHGHVPDGVLSHAQGHTPRRRRHLR